MKKYPNSGTVNSKNYATNKLANKYQSYLRGMSRKNRKQRKTIKQGLPPGTLVYTGDRKSVPAKLLAVHYNESGCSESEQFSLPGPDKLLWLDVRNLTDTALIARVGEEFHIHPLALEDVLNTQQRAKLEEFDNGLFFILSHLKIDSACLELESEQISIFAGQNFTVSFQEDPDDTFEAVRKRICDGLGRIRKKGPDYLMYAMIDTIVDGYYTVLDSIETEVLEIEEQIYKEGVPQHVKEKIFRLKRLLNEFKHRVLPLREAVARFYRAESAIIDPGNRLYFRDLMDHVAQIQDSLDSEREMLSNMEAFYQAEAANRLNHVMRLLTVISTIFIPLTFIAGIYGMNFDNMPEIHAHYGYFILLGIMLLMTLAMLAWFRSKKWL